MSDLEQVLSEAQRAREEAEAAARRATELEEQAATAREQARREREERRRAWAQGVVDAYDSELTAAESAIVTAQERFNTLAVENLPGAVEAYLAWGEAAVRHYAVQLGVRSATEVLGMEASPPEFAAPPPFSDALNHALGARLAARSEQAREASTAEVEQILGAQDPLIDGP